MPTSSGLRRLVHGTRERILSSDHNREQALQNAMLVDALRYLLEAETSEEQAAGITALASSVGSPMHALIFNGLRVRPEIGTWNLFVDPGMGLFSDPTNGTSDDSVGQLVRSAGVTSAGALTIGTPGAGTRIDVVECSVYQAVIETDSRDFFSSATGTFTPALTNKVVEAQLTFRVRQGTPGAGFPGTATGWLPLLVASVPSGALSCDDCLFWDVRPLRSDVLGSHLNRTSFPTYQRQHASAIDEGGAGNWRARGLVYADLQGRLVGGNLATQNSGANFIDLTSGGGNQEPGFSVVANRPWYLYLALPFNLPRWAPLAPASSGSRAPRSPRGIPVFSQKPPNGLLGTPSSALTLPTATGLGSTTTAAVAVLSGAFGAGPVFCNTVVSNDGWTRVGSPGVSLSPSSGDTTAAVVYQLGSTAIPPNATAIRVRLVTTIADTAGDHTIQRSVVLRSSVAGDQVEEVRFNGTSSIPSSSYLDVFETELAIPPNLPTGAAVTRQLDYTITWGSGGSIAYSGQACVVVGWRLG